MEFEILVTTLYQVKNNKYELEISHFLQYHITDLKGTDLVRVSSSLVES